MANTQTQLVRACQMAVILASAACVNIGATGSGDTGADGAQGPEPAGISTSPMGPGLSPNEVASAATPSSGGNTQTPPSTNQPSTSPNTIEPSPVARYTQVGRMVTSRNGSIDMSFLGSKIGASFTGTSLAVVLSDTGLDSFNISIDGSAPIVLFTKPNTIDVTYPIADTLGAGTHTVWMTKRTEFLQGGADGSVGQTTFKGFVLAAGEKFLPPPAAKMRHIEAIGDSSISGYGVDPPPVGPDCKFAAKAQNADRAMPAVLARLLNAEYSNLSFTGQGIAWSGYNGNPNYFLPVIWNQVVAPYPSPSYDFSTPVDVVIISAGGNDLDGPGQSGKFTDEEKFVTTYANWLVAMRRKYKTALIVPLLNPSAAGSDRPTLINAIGKAIALAQTNLGGDPNIVFFDYFADDAHGWRNYQEAERALNLGYGCGYHASAAGHEFLASRLAPFIKKRMNW